MSKNISKPKVNAKLKELKNAGYIEQKSVLSKCTLIFKATKEIYSMSGMEARI